MINKVFITSISLLACLLTGCANLGLSTEDSQRKYSLQITDPDRVRFSGRGAGAGIMLSGTMGAMGIALGVAIDEGIGKDIGEVAAEAEIQFPELFKEVVAGQQDFPIDWAEEEDVADRTYVIQRYGFVTAPGGEDVYPNLIITIVDVDGTERTIAMPDDFTDHPEQIPITAFESIKTNAGEIERLWRHGIVLVLGAMPEKM